MPLGNSFRLFFVFKPLKEESGELATQHSQITYPLEKHPNFDQTGHKVIRKRRKTIEKSPKTWVVLN